MDQRQLLLLQRLRSSNIVLTQRVRDAVEEFVLARWDGMESWHDSDMVRFQNEILPVVLSAERRVADLTNSYLTQARNAAEGGAERAATVDYAAVTGDALRGVDPDEVYMRPQMVLNYELSRGATVKQAVTAGGVRLKALVQTDIQLARTHTVAKQGKRPFYRRVLTGSENCALCVIASTQRYRKGSLLPIHGHCDCGVEELFNAPGQVIDRPTLESLHAAIESEFGGTDRGARDIAGGSNSYSDFLDLIVTHTNSETGPTLAWRDQNFRTGRQAAELAN
jgi:hypothetical protein